MAFYRVLWSQKVNAISETPPSLPGYEPKTWCQSEPQGLPPTSCRTHFMKPAFPVRPPMDPRSLGYSCPEELKQSESQKEGGELHFVLQDQKVLSSKLLCCFGIYGFFSWLLNSSKQIQSSINNINRYKDRERYQLFSMCWIP